MGRFFVILVLAVLACYAAGTAQVAFADGDGNTVGSIDGK